MLAEPTIADSTTTHSLAEAAQDGTHAVQQSTVQAPTAAMSGLHKATLTARNVMMAKKKFALSSNLRALRRAFVSYAEIFGEQQTSAAVVREAFDRIDEDKSGFIDADEMIKMTTALGVPMSRAQIESVMRDMDADGNNQIDFDEFHSWWTLQSSDTKGVNAGMAVFKQQLQESVNRGKLELDFCTFRKLCIDCQLANASSVTTVIGDFSAVPKSQQQGQTSLLTDKQLRKEYRRLVDPDRVIPDDKTLETMTIDVEQFLAAMRRVSTQLFPAAATEAEAIDKMVRRVQRSAGARANHLSTEGEAEFARQSYTKAEKLFSAAIEHEKDRHDFYLQRAACRAALSDWKSAMDDAATCVSLLDRYETGALNSDELASVTGLQTLGSSFYTEPSWLHAQLEPHRSSNSAASNDQPAQAAGHMSARPKKHRRPKVSGADAPVCATVSRGAGGNVDTNGSSQMCTRPTTPEMIASLHPVVAKNTVRAPLRDYASSLVAVQHRQIPNKGGVAALPSTLTKESVVESFGMFECDSNHPSDRDGVAVTLDLVLAGISAAGIELSAEEVARVKTSVFGDSEKLSAEKFASVVNNHERPNSPTREEAKKIVNQGKKKARPRRCSVNAEANQVMSMPKKTTKLWSKTSTRQRRSSVSAQYL